MQGIQENFVKCNLSDNVEFKHQLISIIPSIQKVASSERELLNIMDIILIVIKK